MLLSSVIIVLREVLEAALLFSLMMALSRRLNIADRWAGLALAAGLAGATIYGYNIGWVSEWFDGVGQEVVNAFLQIAVYALLCVLAVLAVRYKRGVATPTFLITIVMASCLTLAMVREGAEILIYLSGFLQVRDLLVPVLAGSVIGAGIGISFGAVFYYALVSLGRPAAISAGALLLVLVAGGMVAQAVQQLVQADWLPAQYPAWDSSWLVDEQSVTGELLYALIGYEASPTPLQLYSYAGAVLLLVAVAVIIGSLGSSATDATDATE